MPTSSKPKAPGRKATGAQRALRSGAWRSGALRSRALAKVNAADRTSRRWYLFGGAGLLVLAIVAVTVMLNSDNTPSTPSWTVHNVADYSIGSSAVYVLTGNPASTVIALDPATGDPRWQTDIGATPNASLHEGGGLLVVSANDAAGNTVSTVLDEAGGKLLGRSTGDPLGRITGTPTLVTMLVRPAGCTTVCARDVYGFDTTTGKQSWHFAVPPTATALVWQLDTAPGTFAAFDNGHFDVWDLNNANPAPRSVALPAVANPATDWILTSPTSAVLITAGDGSMAAMGIDLRTGVSGWTTTLTGSPPTGGPALNHCGNLVCVAYGKGVDAVDPAAGDQVFSVVDAAAVLRLGTAWVADYGSAALGPAVLDPTSYEPGQRAAGTVAIGPARSGGGFIGERYVRGDDVPSNLADAQDTEVVAVSAAGDVSVLDRLVGTTHPCTADAGVAACFTAGGTLQVWSLPA
jgi:hypothetical protein